MAKPLLPDELWVLIQPLIPPHPPQPEGGRPFLDDRKVLTGIIFILKTGLPWEDLPQEMGCGCGMTCWNRLRDLAGRGRLGPDPPDLVEPPPFCGPDRLRTVHRGHEPCPRRRRG